MRYLYPNKDQLIDVSLTGKMVKNRKTKKMNPEKVEIITKMFKQRLLSEESLDALSISDRMNNKNKLLRDAIYKISSTKYRAKQSGPAAKIEHQVSHEADNNHVNQMPSLVHSWVPNYMPYQWMPMPNYNTPVNYNTPANNNIPPMVSYAPNMHSTNSNTQSSFHPPSPYMHPDNRF